MSVQTDIEMLYIEVAEEYSIRYGVSNEELSPLFSQHHVFEKMMQQHEYLHQVPFAEVFEYVESLISANENDIVVYHGSPYLFEAIDLSKSRNRRDFGKGFYTTVLERQARDWVYQQSLRHETKQYYVYKYRFKPQSNLDVKRLNFINKEWLDFIKKNRLKGGLRHDFDIVIGPVADDATMETIQLYVADILTADEAMKRLEYMKANNQISFHTDAAIDCLTLERRLSYERNVPDIHI